MEKDSESKEKGFKAENGIKMIRGSFLTFLSTDDKKLMNAGGDGLINIKVRLDPVQYKEDLEKLVSQQ